MATVFQNCVPETFSDLFLNGSQITSVLANVVQNATFQFDQTLRFDQPEIPTSNFDYCNVTISYNHAEENNTIIVETLLPTDNFNQRLIAVGGAGFVAGRGLLQQWQMLANLAEGYATVTTDAGLGTSISADSWALLSPGHVDLQKLQNLASVSLNDLAILAKQVVHAYSGAPPLYSYWNGCSQGGRQGMMLAQLYPDAFDGIAAGAPAIYWTETMFNMYWSQLYMSMIDQYPYGCELKAITAAAVAYCDPLDGVEDGIVADSDMCLEHFNVSSLVGTTVEDCAQTNGSVKISKAAVMVAHATWQGISDLQGNILWPGFGIATDIASGTASTICNTTTCSMDVSESYGIPANWLQLFVAKDPDFNLADLTLDEFISMFNNSKREYSSIIETQNPDLSEFSQLGGKLISFHGLSDQDITPKGSRYYYQQVKLATDGIQDFYRHFEVPGLAHCFGGTGGQPTSLFAQLRAWVENGTAPETSPISFTYQNVTYENLLYPYDGDL
ncbi:hypothetical protein PFICI_03194 [Pestalotiopsis fici W106-1]|uniref:Carboxylic ester hydrolase n=1 Tax=Pestalotiopsis fici (strain W106-1 / CGMCC3.15140) TaxID=1229662 RepID=W3XGM9_PESFW|nr:uncharacterized protein PFICI_03194 [Pestalotiopsis fici W106-1]ETS85169.1 hypothetical protein PFICI_03194 [Pestalotiopsis fici W106-1]